MARPVFTLDMPFDLSGGEFYFATYGEIYSGDDKTSSWAPSPAGAAGFSPKTTGPPS
jgi:hypothetical protein